MLKIVSSKEAGFLLEKGKVLLYPTEGVWGIGCNPFDLDAVKRLCFIKGRSLDKGLILIVENWDMATSLVKLPIKDIYSRLTAYPAITWLLPATELVPKWIKGNYEKVAIRRCQHPFMKSLQPYWNKALVSTSANLTSNPAPVEFKEIDQEILKSVDGCWLGNTGGTGKPSVIKDFLEDRVIRR